MSVGAPAKSGDTPVPTTSRELIASATQPLDVPRSRRVYVNRNLRLDKIEMVGFDMDYTLALYNQARIEELSMRATLINLHAAVQETVLMGSVAAVAWSLRHRRSSTAQGMQRRRREDSK